MDLQPDRQNVSRAREFAVEHTAAIGADVESATARGQLEMDVVYRLPPSAGEGARVLGEMWDAVDQFCRDGQMLSLESSPEAKLFRRWFLDQFITQTEGADPVPWPEFVRAHG